jgi:hypothetical protein
MKNTWKSMSKAQKIALAIGIWIAIGAVSKAFEKPGHGSSSYATVSEPPARAIERDLVDLEVNGRRCQGGSAYYCTPMTRQAAALGFRLGWNRKTLGEAEYNRLDARLKAAARMAK